MTFSQRMGLEPKKLPLQINEMSEPLRNSLWNYVSDTTVVENWCELLTNLNRSFFNLPVQDVPYRPCDCCDRLRSKFMDLSWDKVYDLLETYIAIFIFQLNNRTWSRQEKRSPEMYDGVRVTCEGDINAILESESSGYRLIIGQFAPITDKIERSAIIDAQSSTQSEYPNVHAHLAEALTLLCAKPTPHYRNSIKESISAVEGLCITLCKKLTGKETGSFDIAIKEISENLKIHSQMQQGFKNLYNYSSNEDGIRHAIQDQKDIGLAEAKYMLVVCSAFVNFVIMKTPTEQDSS